MRFLPPRNLIGRDGLRPQPIAWLGVNLGTRFLSRRCDFEGARSRLCDILKANRVKREEKHHGLERSVSSVCAESEPTTRTAT